MEVGLGPGHTVLDGTQNSSPEGHSPPNFGPCLMWPNGWVDQNSTWYGGRPRPRRHCVRWGRSPPSPKGASHVSCGQTAAWIKMPLGTEVGLGLRDTVLDGNQLHRP